MKDRTSVDAQLRGWSMLKSVEAICSTNRVEAPLRTRGPADSVEHCSARATHHLTNTAGLIQRRAELRGQREEAEEEEGHKSWRISLLSLSFFIGHSILLSIRAHSLIDIPVYSQFD